MEETVIETSDIPLHVTPVVSAHIDNYQQIVDFLSKHRDTLEAITGLFSDRPAGTTIGEALTGHIRGLVGNPTTANVNPAVKVGGPSSSEFVSGGAGTSTGNLSDPGVTQSESESAKEFVSKADFDVALEHLHERIDDIQRFQLDRFTKIEKKLDDLVEEKEIEVKDKVTNALSVDELKSLLMVKLIGKGDSSSEDLDILSLLRTEVESTCKTAAGSSKRSRHDDDDSDTDRPEGEKRLKTYFDTPAAQRIGAVAARMEKTSFKQKYKGKQTEMVEFEELNVPEVEAEDEELKLAVWLSKQEVEKPSSEIVDESGLEKYKLESVMQIHKEVTEQFPPSPGKFRITPADIRKQQQKESQISEMSKQSEWKIPKTAQIDPVHTGSLPYVKKSYVLTREALKKTVRNWRYQDIPVAFLEEKFINIYTDEIEEMLDINLMGAKNAEDVKTKMILNLHTGKKEEIKSAHQIIKLNYVGIQKVLFKDMVSFLVTRSDMKSYTIGHVDLKFINLGDVNFLLEQLEVKLEKNAEDSAGYQKLREFIRHRCQMAEYTDLQLGAESDKAKINLLKPNTKHSKIDQLKMYQVVWSCDEEFDGDEGIVLFNSKGEKFFLRFKEINSYSDGSLKVWTIKIKEYSMSLKEEVDQAPRVRLTEVIKQFDAKRDERKMIRYWQRKMGQRNTS